MDSDKILITGGGGMVGSFLKEILPEAIYVSSKEYDLRIQKDVQDMMNRYKPNVVIHLAAKVGGIMDNIQYPVNYFDDNILMNTFVLQESYKIGVERFIGVLSTCIYPDIIKEYPIKEDVLHDGPPANTNFSYGYAKRCLAVQIDAYNKQYGTKYQYLIPSNMYGEYDKYGENSHFIAALIKKIHLAKINDENTITLYGTGNPLRQFMHASDFARVIKTSLDKNIYESFNVANEENLSIKEMAIIGLKAMNADNIVIKFDETKPDGQYRKDVSIEKLKKYIPDFKSITLEDGIKRTYKYLLTNDILSK